MELFSKIKKWLMGGMTMIALMLPTLASAQGLGDRDLTSTGIINLITRIVNFLITLGGSVAILFIVIGGFQYIFAGGNSEKAGKARTMLLNGIIGFVIIIGAYIIVNTVGTILEGFL